MRRACVFRACVCARVCVCVCGGGGACSETDYVTDFCDIDINGSFWGRVLCFGSAMCLEILLTVTFTHNLL